MSNNALIKRDMSSFNDLYTAARGAEPGQVYDLIGVMNELNYVVPNNKDHNEPDIPTRAAETVQVQVGSTNGSPMHVDGQTTVSDDVKKDNEAVGDENKGADEDVMDLVHQITRNNIVATPPTPNVKKSTTQAKARGKSSQTGTPDELRHRGSPMAKSTSGKVEKNARVGQTGSPITPSKREAGGDPVEGSPKVRRVG